MKNKTIGLLIQLGSILLFLLPAIYMAHASYTFLSTAEQTVGLVLDERRYTSTPGAGSSVGGSQETASIVIYIVKQDTLTVEKKFGLWEELNLGDTVMVKYEPAAPQQARVDTFGESYGLPSLLFILFLIGAKVGQSIRLE